MSKYNPFYDDVKERNSMKSGAYHKKNGSKSKKCTLPSDNLTPAQKKKLNGPVKEYALHEPMSWKDFKRMPTDLQQAHLDYIQRRFRIGASTISSEVFGLSKDGLPFYAKYHGLELMSFRGKRSDAATQAALRAWVSGEEDTPVTDEVAEPESPVLVEQEEPVVDTAPVPEEPVPDPSPAPEESPREKFAVHKLSAALSGSADDLLFYISAMLCGRAANVELTITFES